MNIGEKALVNVIDSFFDSPSKCCLNVGVSRVIPNETYIIFICSAVFFQVVRSACVCLYLPPLKSLKSGSLFCFIFCVQAPTDEKNKSSNTTYKARNSAKLSAKYGTCVINVQTNSDPFC